MTILATRPLIADPDEPTIEQLQRLTPEQFRIAWEADSFPESDRVELVDGLLRRGGPRAPLYRLTLDQYHRMDRAGVFAADERVELLGGWLVARMAINPPHRRSTRRSRLALERVVPPGYYVDQNAPISMPLTDSEPEPDIQVVRGDEAEYPDRHPGPPDVALAVEVSDSTVSKDRNFKLRLYARDAVPVYWIVNLVATRLEVYTDPTGPSDAPGYRTRQEFAPGDEVPLVLDGREVARIAVRDLLP